MGGQRMVADYVSALAGKHIKIVTIIEKPFVMMKNDKYDPWNLSTKTDVEGILLDNKSRTYGTSESSDSRNPSLLIAIAHLNT